MYNICIEYEMEFKMKIAIIDDDFEDAATIKDAISTFFSDLHENYEISYHTNAITFLDEYQSIYDLIIFDIDMPAMNGIDAAKQLRKLDKMSAIMFVTKMPQYALDGYEVEAIDYILKPIYTHDFTLKLKKAMRYISINKDALITINTNNGIVRVQKSDIYYIESQLHYLIIHCKDRNIKTRSTLNDFQSKFQLNNFAFCSKSYLINLSHVDGIDGNHLLVGKTLIPISRAKKQSFLSELTKHMGGIHS